MAQRKLTDYMPNKKKEKASVRIEIDKDLYEEGQRLLKKRREFRDRPDRGGLPAADRRGQDRLGLVRTAQERPPEAQAKPPLERLARKP